MRPAAGRLTARFRAAALAAALCASPAAAEDAHPLLAEGAGVYRDLCAHCHGAGMVNPGTSSFDLRKWPKDRQAEFESSVMNGKGDMPAWGDIILPEELAALWVYVATRGGAEPFEAAAAGPPVSPAADLLTPGALTACLALNGGIMSSRRSRGGAGFDYGVLAAMAEELGLTLAVTWFEAEQDEFADPVPEAYAMLAMPLCDIVAAHPDLQGAHGPPPTARAAPPYWVDRPEHWGHKQVDLQPIAITRPYMRAEQGIVLSPNSGRADITSLDQLKGLRVGVQQGTLGEAILRHQGPAELQASAVTFVPGPAFLWEMENGAVEAALVDVAAYDFHRRQNMITELTLASYRHEAGLNIAFGVLAAHQDLLKAADWALGRVLADGRAAKIAKRERMTYAPPRDGPIPSARYFGLAGR